MVPEQAIQLRTRIIGLLLRDARLAAGKSMKELGEIIGLSGTTISSIERGNNALSLPELELLAFYLGIPMDHFWSDDIVSQEPHPSQNLETESLLALRHRTIAALLRQARNEKNLSQKDLADRTGISSGRIRRYETGETPVPVPELETLAKTLGYGVQDFEASSGPVGEWNNRQQTTQQFVDLPNVIKEFVSDPENQGYLELAQRLSAMPIEKLRAFADSLVKLLD